MLLCRLLLIYRLEDKVDKVKLRATLNECDVEGRDQDLFMVSCVQLVQRLAEGHPDVTGIKLLGACMRVCMRAAVSGDQIA